MLFSKLAGALAAACCIEAFGFRREPSSRLPPLLDATLDELRHGLDHGAFTSTQLVKAYLARIEETNPTLRAVTEINPDALSIAGAMDGARSRDNMANLPLHGIPVLVKDNIATDDRMNNTAGSYALLGAKVAEDSTVVSRLRKAGAIILGKANLSQWAAMRSSNAVDGWSAYGGQTIGAYYPGQNPSGSSSGSGVASSIGLAWASLGTDTAGSIISPSSANNVVGIRPTMELVSRHLVVPVSERHDAVGPMARTVKDAAYLLSAIAGPDSKDNYTSAFPFENVPDYVGACKSSGLSGKRIGVARGLINPLIDDSAGPAMAALGPALDVLRGAGAVVIEDLGVAPLDNDRLGLLYSNMYKVLVADLRSNVGEKYMAHLRHNPNNMASVADMRAFTRSHPLEDYPRRDTLIWDDALGSFNNTSPEFHEARDVQRLAVGSLGLMEAFEEHSLDAMVVPGMFAIAPAVTLGMPVVTVPWAKYPDDTTVKTDTRSSLTSTAPNKPFGLGFLGPKWSEEALIGMAYAFEQRTLARKAIRPVVQPATELADVM